MQNVGPLDRTVRIVLGLALLALAVMHPPFLMHFGAWRWVLGLVGLVLLVTGLVRVCPAYLPFGLSTCRRA